MRATYTNGEHFDFDLPIWEAAEIAKIATACAKIASLVVPVIGMLGAVDLLGKAEKPVSVEGKAQKKPK